MMNEESNTLNHPTLEIAEMIIRAHDDDDNGVLEYQELKNWIVEGVTLSPAERARYSSLGEEERLMTLFLEKVVHLATYEVATLVEMKDIEHKREQENQQQQQQHTLGDQKGEEAELLHGTFFEGALGIKFNSECEVEEIQRDSQGCKFIGLSKGDLLVDINGMNVKGMTLKATTDVLRQHKRPLPVIFERHRKWKRNEKTDLPHVDWSHVYELFTKHQISGGGGGVECAEFAKFMSEVHNLAMGHQGRQPIEHCDMSSIILAQKLIDAHDTNNDSNLEWPELKQWIESGLSMSKSERAAYKARGGYCPDSVRFLEDVAHGCLLHSIDATDATVNATDATDAGEEKDKTNDRKNVRLFF